MRMADKLSEFIQSPTENGSSQAVFSEGASVWSERTKFPHYCMGRVTMKCIHWPCQLISFLFVKTGPLSGADPTG
jgi:hypothetical protein